MTRLSVLDHLRMGQLSTMRRPARARGAEGKRNATPERNERRRRAVAAAADGRSSRHARHKPRGALFILLFPLIMCLPNPRQPTTTTRNHETKELSLPSLSLLETKVRPFGRTPRVSWRHALAHRGRARRTGSLRTDLSVATLAPSTKPPTRERRTDRTERERGFGLSRSLFPRSPSHNPSSPPTSTHHTPQISPRLVPGKPRKNSSRA